MNSKGTLKYEINERTATPWELFNVIKSKIREEERRNSKESSNTDSDKNDFPVKNLVKTRRETNSLEKK